MNRHFDGRQQRPRQENVPLASASALLETPRECLAISELSRVRLPPNKPTQSKTASACKIGRGESPQVIHERT